MRKTPTHALIHSARFSQNFGEEIKLFFRVRGRHDHRESLREWRRASIAAEAKRERGKNLKTQREEMREEDEERLAITEK